LSLICAETREHIRFGEPLYAAEPAGAAACCSVSRKVLDLIQPDVRRPEPCATPEDGLNVHAASSGGPTFRGFYEWSTFRKGAFLFSLSAEHAAQYLPFVWREYQPSHVHEPPEAEIVVMALGPSEVANILTRIGPLQPEAKLVFHHDDPPCEARLEVQDDGSRWCPACKLHPDTQSVCLMFYCPTCDAKLRDLQCPQCVRSFANPGA